LSLRSQQRFFSTPGAGPYVIQPGSAAQVIATIPEFIWELSLGIYLMVKGFKPSPILSGTTGDAGADERPPALAAADR